MAKKDHLLKLNKGTDYWNSWRRDNPEIIPNLKGIDLRGRKLRKLNLRTANLCKANIGGSESFIYETNFRGANLSEANLSGTYIAKCDFSKANLQKVNLLSAWITRTKFCETDLREGNFNLTRIDRVDFRSANLSNANLREAGLIESNFTNANLSGCSVYGASVWNLQLEGSNQSNLVVTRPMDSVITVDNIEVAQFIYLLINNRRIREVIDTITSKVVLILGRFTPERKAVLEKIREKIRQRNYVPVIFDFDKPRTRDTGETISTLAHLARFVIADLTDAKSVLQEIQIIVPNLSVPVQPLLQVAQDEPGMLDSLKKFHWFLELYRYDTITDLLKSLNEKIIAPAEKKAQEFVNR